jgi:D-amino-acid oxidase
MIPITSSELIIISRPHYQLPASPLNLPAEMLIGSELTGDEIAIASEAVIDLAVGYPELADPPWLTELTMRSSLAELEEAIRSSESGSLGLATGDRLTQQSAIERALRAACHFLGVSPALAARGSVTYSGSHALERVIATCLAGRPSTFAVVSEPSIDIIPAMISECNVETRFVAAPSLSRCPDVGALLAETEGNCSLAVVSSPENPTGAHFGADDLVQLANGCAERGVPLLVDQSFLKIAPFGEVVSLIDVAAPDGDWAFMWDTAKTIDLAGERLGFVFASPSLAPRIRTRIEVLQATLPLHTLLLATLALEGAMKHGYLAHVADLVQESVRVAQNAFEGTSVEVVVPPAGGFVLLDLGPPDHDNEGAAIAAQVLADTGVGVVGGDRFFHASVAPRVLLRVAMIREPSVVAAGLERVRHWLNVNHHPGPARSARSSSRRRSGPGNSTGGLRVAVIGAGVNGLSCAHELAEDHAVSVFYNDDLLATTSAVATAIWHVYLVDPLDKRNLDWSQRTLGRLIALRSEPAAGIELCQGIELFRTSSAHRPAWADIAQGFAPLTDEEMKLFPGRKWGYRVTAPTANMDKYLTWLYGECVRKNIQFSRHRVIAIEELFTDHDVVVNCAGLAARELVNDVELFPVRGQYIVFRPSVEMPVAYIGDDEHPGGMAYMIPRDGDVLIGGTEEPNKWDLGFTADKREMVERALEFCDLEPASLLEVKTVTGLRPCRTSQQVRFGPDEDRSGLIHNYGHGGSGFSLAWGCAEDVADIVTKLAASDTKAKENHGN